MTWFSFGLIFMAYYVLWSWWAFARYIHVFHISVYQGHRVKNVYYSTKIFMKINDEWRVPLSLAMFSSHTIFLKRSWHSSKYLSSWALSYRAAGSRSWITCTCLQIGGLGQVKLQTHACALFPYLVWRGKAIYLEVKLTFKYKWLRTAVTMWYVIEWLLVSG